MQNIKIDINDNDQTLIKFLNKYMPKAPNSLLYKWIRKKRIKVNKKRVEPSTLIYTDDIVNLYIYDEEIEKWQEEKNHIKSRIKVDIAFENEDIIIFDKPQNLLAHAVNPEDYGNNVVDYMVDLLISRKEYIPRLEPTFRPAIVNRIDRNTFGLIIGAKNRKSLITLNKDIDNNIKKYYLAIVEGKIDKKLEIKNKLEKDNKNNVKVSKTGKESITIIRPIKYTNEYSLVEVELLTGRTHQIRATLKDINHPIIGDRRYSNIRNDKLYTNQQLVAYKLEFEENIGIKSLKEKIIKSKYEEYIYNLYKKLVENKYN